jgi:hypothetical protein
MVGKWLKTDQTTSKYIWKALKSDQKVVRSGQKVVENRPELVEWATTGWFWLQMVKSDQKLPKLGETDSYESKDNNLTLPQQ